MPSTPSSPQPAQSATPILFLLQLGYSHSENALHGFSTTAERDAATMEMIFGTTELSVGELSAWEGYREELNDSGSVGFEGDPGLQWFSASFPALFASAAKSAELERGLLEEKYRKLIVLGDGLVGVAASVKTDDGSPALTFAPLEKPHEVGEKLTPETRMLSGYLAVVQVKNRRAAEVLYVCAKGVLACFPEDGGPIRPAQSLDAMYDDLLSLRECVRKKDMALDDCAEAFDKLNADRWHGPGDGIRAIYRGAEATTTVALALTPQAVASELAELRERDALWQWLYEQDAGIMFTMMDGPDGEPNRPTWLVNGYGIELARPNPLEAVRDASTAANAARHPSPPPSTGSKQT